LPKFTEKEKEKIVKAFTDKGVNGETLSLSETSFELKEMLEIPIILAKKLQKRIDKFKKEPDTPSKISHGDVNTIKSDNRAGTPDLVDDNDDDDDIKNSELGVNDPENKGKQQSNTKHESNYHENIDEKEQISDNESDNDRKSEDEKEEKAVNFITPGQNPPRQHHTNVPDDLNNTDGISDDEQWEAKQEEVKEAQTEDPEVEKQSKEVKNDNFVKIGILCIYIS